MLLDVIHLLPSSSLLSYTIIIMIFRVVLSCKSTFSEKPTPKQNPKPFVRGDLGNFRAVSCLRSRRDRKMNSFKHSTHCRSEQAKTLGLVLLLSALYDDVCDDEWEEISAQEHKQAVSPITVLCLHSPDM